MQPHFVRARNISLGRDCAFFSACMKVQYRNQIMNSKSLLLTFREEDFDSEEEEEGKKTPSQVTQAVKNAPDRYESHQIQRGFFQESHEEPEYLLVHTQSMKCHQIPASHSTKSKKKTAQQYDLCQNEQIELKKIHAGSTETGSMETRPKITKILEYNFSSSSSDEEEVEQGRQSIVLNPNIYYLPSFLMTSIPENQRLETLVIRNQFAFNAIWPEYKIISKDGRTHLMIGKKKVISTTSNFYITSYIEAVDADHPEHMGKLRGNFLGNIYNVFLKGNKPKESPPISLRSIIATIRFKSLLTSKAPRQLELYALKDKVNYWELKGVTTSEPNLQQLYEQNKESIHYFSNRLPQFNPHTNSFVLNFGGRIHRPSAKNFILQDPITKREVLMMGKESDDAFRMDISSPLIPFVAFCVGLAHCDSKFITD